MSERSNSSQSGMFSIFVVTSSNAGLSYQYEVSLKSFSLVVT